MLVATHLTSFACFVTDICYIVSVNYVCATGLVDTEYLSWETKIWLHGSDHESMYFLLCLFLLNIAFLFFPQPTGALCLHSCSGIIFSS